MKPEEALPDRQEKQNKKNLHRRMSMRWHIFGCLLGFCAFLLLLLWLFQIVYLDAFYQRIKTDQIERTADTISSNIDNEELSELLVRLSQSNDVCVSLIQVNKEGQYVTGAETLYTADILGNCIIHHVSTEDLLRFYSLAAQNNGSYLQVFSRQWFVNESYSSDRFIGWVPGRDKGLSASLIYARVAKNAQGDCVLILLNSNISPVDSTRNTLRVQLIYITGMVIGIALLLSLLIAKYLASPIIKINKSAAKLAKGDFSGGFADGGYQEISQLADTLNYAAEELSRTEKLQQELIANISHDLRTPLTMIGGYAEAMRDIPGENNPENIQVIIDETARLTSLVNDVLDLSKLNAGITVLQLKRYDLTADIQALVDNYNRLLAHDGYQVLFEYDEPCLVMADQTQLSQVISNLLNNALTYTGEDKTVVIRQKITKGLVRVSFTDSGPGIPKQQLADIWKRYYRSPDNHLRAARGSGLGLSIVSTVLARHNGGYGVESSPGQGSTFWFELATDNDLAEREMEE